MNNQHKVLDIFQDKSLRGLVTSLRHNPEMYSQVVKTAVDYEEENTLPDTAFAWPETRRYPINGSEMAKLSCMYRTSFPPENQGIEVPKHVDESLEKAAYFYNFTIPAKRIKKAEGQEQAQMKVAALQDSDYLLPSLKRCPVRNLDEARMVQNILVKNAHLMDYSHLAEASHNLINKMASYKASTSEVRPVVYKYAGLTLSNKDLLLSAITRRLDFIRDDAHKEAYHKLAHEVDEMDFNRVSLVKTAATLEGLDKKANLRRLYDKHLLNPIESVFNTNKVFDGGLSKTAGQDMFTDEMANLVTEEQIKNILGEEVLDESRGVDGAGIDRARLVEVINSLPQDMINDLIDRI